MTSDRETKRFYHFLTNHVEAIGKCLGIVFFLLILFAPSPEGLSPNAQRLAATTVLMACLWFTQAIPIAATALIPLIAFPCLGIQPSAVVSKAYINSNVFLFLGGFVIALGIERWGLHRRIALHIVRVLGTSLRRIVLGFMVATGFLSMWISNTASTLLMMPIGLAILVSLESLMTPKDQDAVDQDVESSQEDVSSDQKAMKQFSTVLMLGIAYAASIGGLTTMVGTPTNIQFLQVWEETLPNAPAISTGNWIFAILPLGIIFLFCTWQILIWGMPSPKSLLRIDRSYFTGKIKALGKPSRAELLMLFVFVTTAVLWLTRTKLVVGEFVLLPGWSETVKGWLLNAGVPQAEIRKYVDDSTVAIGMSVLMFFIPATKESKTGRIVYLMNWKTAEKLPWGIILLFGGGFAIAGAFTSTRLSVWLGEYFAAMTEGWSLVLIIISICFLMTFLTEYTSNVATVAALMPIIVGIAISMQIDPRLLMIPATLSSSCAFMMPIATPPNAIIFGSGKVSMSSMIRYGIVLNLIGTVLITVCLYFVIIPMMEISTEVTPEWLPSVKN